MRFSYRKISCTLYLFVKITISSSLSLSKSAIVKLKAIDVYTGKYTDAVLPNSNLNPSSTNILIIQNHDTEKPEINASGNSYGIKTTIPNVKIQGMYIYSATNNNIETTGANTEICYNKVTTSFGNGIYLTGINSNVHHNLSFYNRSSAIYINGEIGRAHV